MITLNDMAKTAHLNSRDKGFWTGQANRNLPTKIALIHSEVSEVLEALRHNNPPSDHVPEISSVAEELADIIIRVGDLAIYMGIDLEKAIDLKMLFNSTRPIMHGNKAF
jgi:NTP pyrophosphatase (non-canonical NTP hydrolase)